MTSELGLRERKKLATRAALSHAAWSLMVEHGLGAVTPEAVAEAVVVSPRTFRNYFASCEEAILYGLVRHAESISEAIRSRPPDESVWDSLGQVLPSIVTGFVGERGDLVVLMRAVRDNPAMLAQHLVTFERAHWLLTEVIAERTGTDVDRDLAPRLLAAVAGVALRISLETWAEGATDLAPPDLVRDSLAQLRAGLPLGGGLPLGAAAPTA